MIRGIERATLVSVVDAGGVSMAAIATPTGVVRPREIAPYPGVLQLVQDWTAIGPVVTELLRAGGVDSAELLDDVQLVTLLSFPSKILCSGPNFTDHLAEMGESNLGEGWTPYFFFKPPTTTLRPSGHPFEIDSVDDRVDWEGELAVVIGIGGRDIAVTAALDHVAGYTVANDISLRRPHRRDTPAAPFQWDWVASKAADGSLPLGPGMIPAGLIDDPQQLSIRTTVNGVVRQDGKTSNMVFSVAELVAHASRVLTLEPGDVLLTGTPAGVGAGSGHFLSPGDIVTVAIPGVGTLTTTITQRETR